MIEKFSRLKVALPLTALALAMSAAHAAPTVGSPNDATFYTYPTVSGTKGDLISYRTATLKLGTDAPEVNSWNVVYQSKDSLDGDFAVTGTTIVPKAAWTGTGPRPVILYAVGTHGLDPSCGPAKQLAKGTDYETANIVAALKQGYAVLVTDYEGQLSGAPSTYLAGKSQAHATLDILKASAAIPNSGVSATAPAAVWGYSQGGQTAAWAAEELASYAPDLKIVGIAAGGIPADFLKTSRMLNGSTGFAFLGMAINGLGNQYPGQIPIELLQNDAGAAALAKLNTECVFKALFEFQNQDVKNLTKGSQSLDALLAVEPVRVVLTAQDLGKKQLTVPLYQYHGQADEFIPLDQDIALRKTYCAKYKNVTFDLYPSEHIVTQFQAAPTVLAWLGDRFAGKAVPSSCDSKKADPVATTNPGGGDLIVSLNQWPLAATVHLKLLNSDVILPAASSFSAQANVTAKTLNGNLSVPSFNQKVNLIGLKLPVGLQITPAGPVTGSVSLDDEGILHIKGKAPVDIVITSLVYIPFGACKTVTPVEFPLVFDGPISSLGNGKLTFSDTVTFPKITGCGISGTLSAFFAGAGQKFTFTVSPPAPVRY